jgi:AraC-like DNA-binding protein
MTEKLDSVGVAREFRRLARFIAPQPTSAPVLPSDESRTLAAIGRLVTRQREVLLPLTLSDPALVVVIAGRKHVHIRDTASVFRPGALVALPAGVPIDIVNEPDPAEGLYQVLFVSLQPVLLKLFAKTYPDLALPHPASLDIAVPAEPAIISAFAHAFEAMLQPQRYGREVIAHRMVEVLLALALRGHARWLWTPAGEKAAQRVRQLVLLDPGRSWSAPEIARRLGLSTATLGRRLRDEGASLRRLIEDIRMAEARKLLTETNEPVGMIALRCGYESASRFVSRFRHHHGFTPGESRRAP